MGNIRHEAKNRDTALLILFFLSGATALVYQVIWQKLLFTALGVDIHSVAIVVSTFMLGLGLGALFGGEFAERFPDQQITFFIAVEICIGIFGLVSYDLLIAVATMAENLSLFLTGAVNFVLLLFPTILMGATLPVLVSHLYKMTRNVGLSIGNLYFSNTCGAALGSFFAGFILLNFFAYSETLLIAGAINLAVAGLAYQFIYREQYA